MDFQIIEHFKQISTLLKSRQEPVTIFQISKILHLSVSDSQYILNCFISQGNNLKEYIVIFSAEILEENKIKTVFIPSYSPKLNDILGGSIHKLLVFGVFAILKKVKDFELKDYSVFCYENEIIENIKVNKIIKQEKNSSSSNSTKTLNTAAVNNKREVNHSGTSTSTGVINNKNPFNKEINKQNDNKSLNKSEPSLSKVFTSKININKEKEMSKSSSLIRPVIEEKNFTKEDDIREIVGNYQEIDAEHNNKNYSQSDVVLSNQIETSQNECYYENPSSIFGEKARQNNHTNNVIINYNPKHRNEEKGNNENSEKSSDVPVAEKRKRIDFESDSELGSKMPTKKKNETVETNVSFSKIKEYKEEELVVQNNPVIEDTSGVKKVKKIRKVKKTNTYYQNNYLVTKDEEIEEEYWTDEKVKPLPIHQPFIFDNKNKKPTGNKKVANGQSSLHSFFSK